MITLWALFRIIRGIMFISPSFTRMAQVGWTSKFINCCRNVIICLSVNGHFVNFRKTMLQIWWTKLFYWIFAQKIINCQFLSYDIESAKNKCIYGICILKQRISCSIAMYLILAKMTNLHFGANLLFPLLKYMINTS